MSKRLIVAILIWAVCLIGIIIFLEGRKRILADISITAGVFFVSKMDNLKMNEV